MVNKIEFFRKYPKLIEDGFQHVLDAERVWRTMLLLHDALLNRLAEVVRRKNPGWQDNEIYNCARLSLLNMLSGLSSIEGNDLLFFYALREWLTGDMDAAENLAKEWMVQSLVSGANKAAIKNLVSFSQLSERFMVSEGHKRKAANFSERNAKIAAEFQKLTALGVLKQDVYARLTVRHDVGVRQLQRVLKNSKNVI